MNALVIREFKDALVFLLDISSLIKHLHLVVFLIMLEMTYLLGFDINDMHVICVFFDFMVT